MFGFAQKRPINRLQKPVRVSVHAMPTNVPVSTAGASKAASVSYLGPRLARNPRQRAMLPQSYLFDGLTAHPGQAILQAHPASGFVYPWQKLPVKPGGGVPQAAPWQSRGANGKNVVNANLHTEYGADYLSPKLTILTPEAVASSGSSGVGTGSGGGGGGGGGYGGGIGGGGGGRLK